MAMAMMSGQKSASATSSLSPGKTVAVAGGVSSKAKLWKKWKIVDRAMNASLALQTALTPKIDNRPAVVIEIGCRLTKVGFAGEFIPREIFRSEWQDPLDGPGMSRPRSIFDRHRTEQEQFELLVHFLKDIVFRRLLTTINNRRIVIVESLLTPTWQRQALARALFECPSLMPHSVLFAPSHLLCSFPFNARTCLVLDLGADEGVLLPMAEGVLMLNSWETSSNACTNALEQNVKQLMLRYGRVLKQVHHHSLPDDPHENDAKTEDQGRLLNEQDLELAESLRLWEDLVVRFCFVTTAARGRRLQAHLNSPEESPFDQEVPPLYLQFGAEMLYVPGIVREGAAEALFMHCDEPDNRSVPQLLLDCVARVSVDLRREFLNNILIVGGVSRVPGFLARVKTELLNLLADGYRPQLAPTLTDLKFYQFPEEFTGQLFCAWLGGAMFGALDGALEQRSLTKQQWQADHNIPDWTNTIDSYFSELPQSDEHKKTTIEYDLDCGKRINERSV